ncbi:uncharacterized protein LOC130896821 [Diorhabda carinulata]|uniref:uncharacterized protein LOC130896821 n=1 Tax=Diorhabda carinulata TaxID=1163345 RepID=UPI0025A1588E|nr:uncharacterized protein LOC130896821 [Diorhabda carinulata]
MKTQKSKFTQVTTNDNELKDYQNIGITILPTSPVDVENRNSERNNYQEGHCQNINKSSDLLLRNTYGGVDPVHDIRRYSPERNSERFLAQTSEDIELCNCITPIYQKTRLADQWGRSHSQTIGLNRSFSSLPKMENLNYSLDRKTGKYITRPKETHRILRVQSPEIINIHRGPFCEGYETDCREEIGRYKYKEHEFRRGHSVRSVGNRSGGILSNIQQNRRAAGDGMDAEMNDPEIVFEMSSSTGVPSGQLGIVGECQCPCDHVIYNQTGYSGCLQEERPFGPAPDVTRRMGSTTVLGKAVPPGSPPYYRSTSAASSSSNSGSSRVIDMNSRHWWLIGTVLLIATVAGVGVPIALKISSSASFEERLEFATRLLQEVPLIDGHNDLPWNIRKFLHNKLKNFKFNEDLRNISPWSNSAWSHTDLVRLEQGHVAAQFWAAYVPCDSQFKDAVQLTFEQIDVIRRFTEHYQPRLTLCTSSEDIKSAYKRRQLCSLIGVEGGHSLAGSLAVLRTLYHVGVRYLTLTSTCNTPWADCSHADLPGKKPEHGGLTNFGKSVVKEMNRLGMIVDLSHVSVNTMRDALEVSKAPVIFSHSSAHALCNSTRNVPDDTLRKLALNKGVIMVNFYSLFLTCKEVSTISDAVAHINHIRDIAGVDCVGIGAGYDGINYVPQGLEDVSAYPTLFAELIGTGKWSVEDLKKLAGLNFLRVFQAAEKIRDDFKKANVPPYEDVMPKPKDINCSSQSN